MYQVAVGAPEFCQTRVAADPKISQLRFVAHHEGASQLVVACPQGLQVGHIVHARQLGDGAVLAVQIGYCRAGRQARDTSEAIVVVTPQVGQRCAVRHVKIGQAATIALEFG